MSVKVTKVTIPYLEASHETATNALAFLPGSPEELRSSMAVFTHGFTSHKASIFNWALRLAEEGVPSLLFDLPGHYLGTFSEVDSFEDFQTSAPAMFQAASAVLTKEVSTNLGKEMNPNETRLILGGHSLGALLSLKASTLPFTSSYKDKTVVAVGFGLPPQGVTHIFNTPFYKSTLKVRAQLVSPAISPEVIFPWIKEEKEALSLSGENIYLLTGGDDVVVGKDGTERLRDQLSGLANNVTLEKPAKLPHHVPENAAPHIKKYLKDQGHFS